MLAQLPLTFQLLFVAAMTVVWAPIGWALAQLAPRWPLPWRAMKPQTVHYTLVPLGYIVALVSSSAPFELRAPATDLQWSICALNMGFFLHEAVRPLLKREKIQWSIFVHHALLGALGLAAVVFDFMIQGLIWAGSLQLSAAMFEWNSALRGVELGRAQRARLALAELVLFVATRLVAYPLVSMWIAYDMLTKEPTLVVFGWALVIWLPIFLALNYGWLKKTHARWRKAQLG